MTKHLYENRTYKKLESLSDKVGGILEAIAKGAFLMACLTVPIWLLTNFSETMTIICEYMAVACLYVFIIALGIYGFSFIITIIVRIVAGTMWECVWAISKLLASVRKQIANSFKV